MTKKNYPRVTDSIGQSPRELTEEEKVEYDSLIYKYGKKKGSELFASDFHNVNMSKAKMIKQKKEKKKDVEDTQKLIEFYLRSGNEQYVKKSSVRSFLKKHGFNPDGTVITK